MQAVHITLLQSATLGRQTLAPGVSLHVPPDVAQAWVQAGIAASNVPLPPAGIAQPAIETIAATQKRSKRGT